MITKLVLYHLAVMSLYTTPHHRTHTIHIIIMYLGVISVVPNSFHSNTVFYILPSMVAMLTATEPVYLDDERI